MPTSITVAPGRMKSRVTIAARPIAATRMSAWRATSGRLDVLEWQIVTVACWCRSSSAIGFPTMSLRPITTACRPAIGMFSRRSISMMPAGVHGRPEGAGESPVVLALWTYELEPVEPTFPIEFDAAYPEIVMRGMARMIPAMARYLGRLPRCFVDGGYYTKTRENRFLAGPLPVEGAYVLGALSGYGLMASNGAADLLADHIAERPLPRYARAFHLDRYDDPAYRALLDRWGDSGQL